MPTLFAPSDRQAILQRLGRLDAASARQWGKMDPAQMLAHCSIALEACTGDRPMKQMLIGRLLGPFARGRMLGDAPFRRDSPTHPSFVVSDQRDFAAEKARALMLIDRLCERGPEQAGRQTHAFLGRLSGEEWGRLMYKHLDHHLRQFGV